ncbi:MAG: hypothetical protein HN348_24190, partial [Proteobacteria bacterium]|nr:hypothetical protein [Pseudomonadota bacterium]
VYLVGYVGINLYTMGQALNIMLGWPVFVAAALVASISAVYVTFGGQTSVIMTDLFQGVMLMVTGLILLALGIHYLGGPTEFWEHLPRTHRTAFPNFNSDPSYNSVGVFWQDAMANSAMFYFLNQGMVMRLMSARSVKDSRRAMVVMLLILMPIAAIVVASGGWVGQALVHSGNLPADIKPEEAFFIAANFLSRPGVFGLIMAALTAALMSTVDTLITAIAAIVVNDLYKPSRPKATEKDLLRVARISSVSITLLGVGLVPVFISFGSIYSAHAAFTAAVTPPLVVALLLGVFWRRYTPKAAYWTMVGGTILIMASVIFPEMVWPFAHGVPMKEVDPGFLAGKDQYKFMRAFFGIVCCTSIGVIVTLFTKAKPLEEIRGLVWGTVGDAIAWYKGSAGTESESVWAAALPITGGTDTLRGSGQLPVVRISEALAKEIEAGPNDLLYLSDRRAWLGGLRSSHALIDAVTDELKGNSVELGPMLHDMLARGPDVPLRVKRLY